METLSLIAREICLLVGMCTIAMLIVCAIMGFIEWIKDILRRQSKIRWLCQHAYTEEWCNESISWIEYETKCSKCGKKKTFLIFKKKWEG